MTYTLEEFCNDAHNAIDNDKGDGGREVVRQHLVRLLANPDFIAEYCGPDLPKGTKLLYRDAEFGFDVLAHCFDAGAKSPPHDHGDSWAIYSQARGTTDVVVWRAKPDSRNADGHAELEVEEAYQLKPGDAGLFNPGVIHSVDFTDGSRYIRVTGTDLNQIPQSVYDLENKSVQVGSPVEIMEAQIAAKAAAAAAKGAD